MARYLLKIDVFIIKFAAVVDFDYFSILSEVIFYSGSSDNTTRCVDIFIIDFFALEGDQTFTLILNTSDTDVMLGNRLTTITIIDNHG